MKRALNEQAIEILRTNDRGGYTIPTARLYPYQWNWDSAFVALGFMTFDRERAWRELEFLLEGQWRNGMVPSILFRHEDPDYFPGPASWQTHEDEPMPSTGLSQPLVPCSQSFWPGIDGSIQNDVQMAVLPSVRFTPGSRGGIIVRIGLKGLRP